MALRNCVIPSWRLLHAIPPSATLVSRSQALRLSHSRSRMTRQSWSRCSTTPNHLSSIVQRPAPTMLRLSFLARQMRLGVQAVVAVRPTSRRRAMCTGLSGANNGDTDKGFTEADVIVESEYFTQVQTHSALETHGFVVDWKPDEVTVYASTQGTSSVRNEFADVFKLPKSKVRVITEYMGGGFGAKFGAGNEGVVAREPVAQGERAGKADARSPAGAHRQQPARLASDAQNRRKERRHSHRHPAHQLRHRRRGNRRRHRGSSNQSVQMSEPADRRVRRLHQRGSRRGLPCAGTSAGMLRFRADHR